MLLLLCRLFIYSQLYEKEITLGLCGSKATQIHKSQGCGYDMEVEETIVLSLVKLMACIQATSFFAYSNKKVHDLQHPFPNANLF